MGVFQRTATTLVNKAGKTLVDLVLNANSNNPIANSAVTAKFDEINSDLGNKSSASSVTGDDAFTKIENLSDIVARKQPSGTYVKFGTMNNLQDMYFQLYIDGATKYLQVILTINGTRVTRTITQWT